MTTNKNQVTAEVWYNTPNGWLLGIRDEYETCALYADALCDLGYEVKIKIVSSAPGAVPDDTIDDEDPVLSVEEWMVEAANTATDEECCVP